MAELMPSLLFTGRVLLGGFFVFSGLMKLRGMRNFGAIAASYRIVPDRLKEAVRYSGYVLPFTELAFGALVLIWRMPLIALLALLAQLAVFLAAQIYELRENPGRPNCGCFGTALEIELSWEHVLFDLLLLLIAVSLLGSMLAI